MPLKTTFLLVTLHGYAVMDQDTGVAEVSWRDASLRMHSIISSITNALGLMYFYLEAMFIFSANWNSLVLFCERLWKCLWRVYETWTQVLI